MKWICLILKFLYFSILFQMWLRSYTQFCTKLNRALGSLNMVVQFLYVVHVNLFFFLPGLLKLCKEERKKLVEAGGTSKKPVGRRSSVKKSASQRLSRSRTRINRSQSGKSLSYIGLFGNSPNQLSYKWIWNVMAVLNWETFGIQIQRLNSLGEFCISFCEILLSTDPYNHQTLPYGRCDAMYKKSPSKQTFSYFCLHISYFKVRMYT